MDRTQDSDSWGVGSIPAGCIDACTTMEEYMEKFLDKVKEVLKKVAENAKPFCKKVFELAKEHKRYLAVVGLFAVMVVVLVFFTGPNFNAKRIARLNSITVSGDDYVPDAEFEVNAYPAVNSLIQQYFTAYVNADFAALEKLATPVSDMEKSYITTMSQFYEEYTNITCYTKHGLSQDSYIVTVCFDIKFVGQEVTAPSMLLFYVQTDPNGLLYINNLYSDFNIRYEEQACDANVLTALRKYATQTDFVTLQNEVNAKYNQVIKENNAIYQLAEDIIPRTGKMWNESVYYVQSTETEEGTESTEVTEDTQTTEPTEEPEDTEEEPVVNKVKIVNVATNVNIRKEADGDSEDIGDAHNGDIFEKLGEESDGTHVWIKVKFDGDKVGFVRSDFTQDVTE